MHRDHIFIRHALNHSEGENISWLMDIAIGWMGFVKKTTPYTNITVVFTVVPHVTHVMIVFVRVSVSFSTDAPPGECPYI